NSPWPKGLLMLTRRFDESRAGGLLWGTPHNFENSDHSIGVNAILWVLLAILTAVFFRRYTTQNQIRMD
ncbi:MAG: hypothetical protein O2912_03310, partial [Proteobacteria bacterium]|nr:hypothetical protein [Pseudomonadota bacterium]